MEEVESIVSCHPSPAITDGDPRKSQENVVKLGWSTCYIVCGLIVRDGKVLMIQEAKQSCRGMWYMPAGRMEKGESLETAVKREVKEESGYDFEPKALIAVEFQSLSWVRFTFVGDVIGGELKTPEQADKESIQAQWMTADISKLTHSSLRANDCLKLIDLANKWHQEDVAHRYKYLPVTTPHVNSSLRVVLVRQSGDELFVCLRDAPFPGTSMRVPCTSCGRGSPMNDIQLLLKSCGYSGEYKLHGLLGVEHKVEGGDGIGISVLLSCNDASLKDGCGYSWQPVTGLADKLKKLMKSEYPLIRLIDLWH